MAHTIAVAGKGGVGKTTLTGLLIEYLCQKKQGPVLAVDADANSNLNEVLGVELHCPPLRICNSGHTWKSGLSVVRLQNSSSLCPGYAGRSSPG